MRRASNRVEISSQQDLQRAGAARVGGELRVHKKPRDRARSPQSSAMSRPVACACSQEIIIHTVIGIVCEMPREARGDQGLLPVVRFELRTTLCGALRAAAAERRAVAHWWELPWQAQIGSARPLGLGVAVRRVGRREWPLRCGTVEYMS